MNDQLAGRTRRINGSPCSVTLRRRHTTLQSELNKACLTAAQTVYVYRLMPCRQATIAATSVHSELSISKTVAVVFVNYV